MVLCLLLLFLEESDLACRVGFIFKTGLAAKQDLPGIGR
jgi:hypothetical protein